MTSDTVELKVPEPDFDGLEKRVTEEYIENRWSEFVTKRDPFNGGHVTIVSGKHPAFSRFVKDIRPMLHEHGFVVSKSEDSHYSYREEKECHVVTAIPMIWVVAYANGYVCNRGACRNVTENAYCEVCHRHEDEDGSISDPDYTEMVHP